MHSTRQEQHEQKFTPHEVPKCATLIFIVLKGPCCKNPASFSRCWHRIIKIKSTNMPWRSGGWSGALASFRQRCHGDSCGEGISSSAAASLFTSPRRGAPPATPAALPRTARTARTAASNNSADSTTPTALRTPSSSHKQTAICPIKRYAICQAICQMPLSVFENPSI